MHQRFLPFVLFVAIAASAADAAAQCPPDCPVKGGGDEATDCHLELASEAIRLNSPFYNPAKPKAAKEIRCFDGDPGCDLDGVANNSCTFDLDVCLRNADPSLAACTASDVTAVSISGSTTKYPALATLQSAIDALLPATTNVCTSGQEVVVPLKGPTSKGEFKATKFTMKVTATAGGDDKDAVKFVCVPRGWPSHSFDASNTRASTLETKIDASNVSTLVQKWLFVPPNVVPAPVRGKAVTSSITVGRKLVYTSSWNGRVYALDKKKGKVKWTFNTGTSLNAFGSFGVQSSVTLTPDGRVLVGDSLGRLYCLDGKKGTVLWQADAGSADPDAAHIWGSPTVVNNRVLIGIASHNDAPCTRGTLVAYDLDTGDELWRQHTVPERVCFDDTSNECSANADCTVPGSPCLVGNCDSNPDIACATNGDCPATFLTPGTCVTGECWLERSISCSSDAECPACIPGKGGGVTATAAASADGNDVYMASVGCLSYPSIGNSDSIFKLDAATGAVDWVYRTEAPEQFQSFVGGPTYHDYGFLNGPILATVGGSTPVAVAGGKDGTLYAVNQSTGLLEWSNVLAAPPTFAGFGLFNGAVAYEPGTDQFFAALYSISTYPGASDHLLSFAGADGTTGWSDQIGSSWSSPTIANGLLYVGNLADPTLFAYDTTLGTLEAELAVPGGNVLGGAAIENGVVYIPFGSVGGNTGGVVAYELPALP